MKRRNFLSIFLGALGALFGKKAKGQGSHIAKLKRAYRPISPTPVPIYSEFNGSLSYSDHEFTTPNELGYGFCLRCGTELTSYVAEPSTCDGSPLTHSKEEHMVATDIGRRIVEHYRRERTDRGRAIIQAIADDDTGKF